jgi:hypothetical protein
VKDNGGATYCGRTCGRGEENEDCTGRGFSSHFICSAVLYKHVWPMQLSAIGLVRIDVSKAESANRDANMSALPNVAYRQFTTLRKSQP